MVNFLEETKEELRRNKKTLDDIFMIYGEDFQITKENFIEFADQIYDHGYGCQEMPRDIVLLGKDFWLTRHEYDGSECWEFHTMPNPEDIPFSKIEKKSVAFCEKMKYWEA